MLVNGIIKKIGLYYVGHFGSYRIQAEIKLRGGTIIIVIPSEELNKFMRKFDNEYHYNIEDGIYLDEMEGTAVVCELNKDNRIIGIGDILAKEDELVRLCE